MKLAFIIDSKKNIGGGEYAQYMFAMELAKRGHQIKIFSGEKNFLSEELKSQKNLEIKYRKTIPLIKKRIGLGYLDRTWSKAYYKFYAQNEIKKFRPDWIIGYLRESAIKAQRIGERLKIKVANFIFETPPWMKEQLGKDWEEELKNKSFAKSWEKTKKAYANTNILIPNSELARKKCEEWLPESKVSVPVYPGVTLPKENKKNKTKRDIDIIYIGRLDRLKNVNELFNACKDSNYRIAIIGKGDEEENLRSLAKQNKLDAEFKGAVTDKEKWELLSRSKLLVFPTSFEGFGMPPLEAAATGCQVLCSDIPILKEIYKDNVHYFKLHNEKELSEKIRMILTKKLKPKNPDRIIKKYTWTKSAKKIEDILKKAESIQ